MLPRIGLTMWSAPDADREHIATTYAQSIIGSGGLPILLSRMAHTPEAVDEILDLLDGLILSGGNDIDPAHYGKDPDLSIFVVPARDAFEFALLKGALERDMPLLGICRGFQLMNIAQGGSLHVDLSTHNPTHISHVVHADKDKGFIDEGATHSVRISGTSRLFEIMQSSELTVNTIHHQGIERLGAELEVNAISEDGLIEGIEHRAKSFALGVQWHPEILCTQDDPASRRLFDQMISAAQAYHDAQHSEDKSLSFQGCDQ